MRFFSGHLIYGYFRQSIILFKGSFSYLNHFEISYVSLKIKDKIDEYTLLIVCYHGGGLGPRPRHNVAESLLTVPSGGGGGGGGGGGEL